MMRQYRCAKCRYTCRCGKKPDTTLIKFDGLVILGVVVFFVIGLIFRGLIWLAVHPRVGVVAFILTALFGLGLWLSHRDNEQDNDTE